MASLTSEHQLREKGKIGYVQKFITYGYQGENVHKLRDTVPHKCLYSRAQGNEFINVYRLLHIGLSMLNSFLYRSNYNGKV